MQRLKISSIIISLIFTVLNACANLPATVQGFQITETARQNPTQTHTPFPSMTSTQTDLFLPSATLFPTQTPTESMPVVTPTSFPSSTPSPPLDPLPPYWLLSYYWKGGKFGLAFVKANGTGFHEIISPSSYPQPGTWSPDGQWIVFDAKNELYVIRPDGSERQQVSSYPGWKNFQWMPDSQTILYKIIEPISLTKSLLKAWYQVDIRTGYNQKLDELPLHYENNATFRVSALGDRVALVSESGESGIYYLYLVNLDGSDWQQVTNIPTSSFASFAWSPSGNQIIFSADQHGENECSDLFIVNVDGTGLQQLTYSIGDDQYPEWSPDGQWISYTSYENCIDGKGGGHLRSYVMHVDGSNLLQIPDEVYKLSDWSPLPPLEVGGGYTITESGDNLGLRDAPTLSGTVKKWLRQGTAIEVLEGPVEADEYLWWRVRVVEGGAEGWVNEIPGWFFSEW